MEQEVRARVITQEKGLYRLRCGEEERLAEVSGRFRYQALSPADYPAVGDYVTAVWPQDGSNATITGLFPRKSVFVRKAAGREVLEQVVAANIDTVFVCMSLNNNFSLRRLERYLATAWDSGAAPVVVLTKADLCNDLPARLAEVGSAAAGADIVAVSSLTGDIAPVLPYLQPGRTVAFLGSSGVGKSTLINRLLGREALATAATGTDDKGRHTTTHRELLALPCGAFVIDTPGMRELGMWEHGAGIDSTFADITDLTARCRFADCTHTREPGCAVLAALQDGTLDEERWASYRKLKAESDFAAGEGEYLQAKREKFKQIAKINKARGKQHS